MTTYMRAARCVTSLALAATSAVALLSGPAAAQTATQAMTTPQDAPAYSPLSEGVVAVVNDDLISSYDLGQRIRLLALMSSIPVNEQTAGQLQREALSSLVDERLKLQELRRVEKDNKTTIVSTDKEVDEQIADMARGNRLTPDQLMGDLAQRGIGPQTFRDQLRVSQSWDSYIGGRYGSRLKIGEDQIKAYEQRLAETASKPQYEISEVFLDAARVGGMQTALDGAGQLLAQIQQGAPFEAVAQQFSASASAANGGDAGWVASGDLPPEVEAALIQMRPGQLSQPIAVKDGVYIVRLRDKRSGADALMVNLKQAAVSLAADAAPAQVEAARAKLETLRAEVKSCEALEPAAAKIDGVVAGDLGEAEIKDLAPAFQEAAKSLQVGQISAPIRTDAGLHLVAVCGKRQGGLQAPSHEQIENRLRGQQMALISKRALRDLRNAATIETR